MTLHPIILVYHCVFQINGQLLSAAPSIIASQMDLLERTGLLDASSKLIVGVNGGSESRCLAASILPSNAQIVYHGHDSYSENRTIVLIEEYVKKLKGEAYVFYIHSKGATKSANDPINTPWRGCMMRNIIRNWRRCIADLDSGFESVGCHFMSPPLTPPKQYIWAGNFWASKASYLLTLPRLEDRARIKMSGMGALESRYESEVWHFNGFRLPALRDYHQDWNPSKVATCI